MSNDLRSKGADSIDLVDFLYKQISSEIGNQPSKVKDIKVLCNCLKNAIKDAIEEAIDNGSNQLSFKAVVSTNRHDAIHRLRLSEVVDDIVNDDEIISISEEINNDNKSNNRVRCDTLIERPIMSLTDGDNLMRNVFKATKREICEHGDTCLNKEICSKTKLHDIFKPQQENARNPIAKKLYSTSKMCKFGIECHKYSCTNYHPSGRKEKCDRNRCTCDKLHAKIMCREGEGCKKKNDGCIFMH